MVTDKHKGEGTQDQHMVNAVGVLLPVKASSTAGSAIRTGEPDYQDMSLDMLNRLGYSSIIPIPIMLWLCSLLISAITGDTGAPVSIVAAGTGLPGQIYLGG